jgi:hypothetical protein
MARAQFVQQGGKLVGTGAVGIDVEQGTSAALSADGNTAILGAQNDNGNAGAAWVFTRTAGVWRQQGSKLVGAGGVSPALQGKSVALSADGSTAIVGGQGLFDAVGAAWVYTRSGGVWSQQGDKLVGTGGAGSARQGASVALSADGNTAIVGGYVDNGGRGAAWVYTRSGNVWSQQGGKLVGAGAVEGVVGAQQGTSVALSADGNTAIVGGVGDNGNAGAAWVYTRSDGAWRQQGPKLVGTGAVEGVVGAQQGYSVALSADGNTAIVGGLGDTLRLGATWAYTRSGGVWSQQGDKLVGTGAIGPALQGSTVALSADGNTAIVGGYRDNAFIGAVWVYTRSGGVWSQQGGKLVGTGAVGSDAEQGSAVALSADASTAIVGGPKDNGGAGAAWVFVNPSVSTAPSIASGGVVNGASFLPGIAPGTWTTIQGSNLSATT